MDKGLALLTESRKEDGLVLTLSVKDNMTLASLRKFATLGWLWPRQEIKESADYINRLSIKTPSLRQQVRLLSGGNQQSADGAMDDA
ncbi:MAG: hypothetical protein R2839_04915 [Thermomicrobiales bacterium]